MDKQQGKLKDLLDGYIISGNKEYSKDLDIHHKNSKADLLDKLNSLFTQHTDQVRREAVKGYLETMRTNAPDFYGNYVDYLLEHKGLYLNQSKEEADA